jgi:hypothetical protein
MCIFVPAGHLNAGIAAFTIKEAGSTEAISSFGWGYLNVEDFIKLNIVTTGFDFGFEGP